MRTYNSLLNDTYKQYKQRQHLGILSFYGFVMISLEANIIKGPFTPFIYSLMLFNSCIFCVR